MITGMGVGFQTESRIGMKFETNGSGNECGVLTAFPVTQPRCNGVDCAFQMRDMNHENVNQFIGLCTEAPHISIVAAFCSRRSLHVY